MDYNKKWRLEIGKKSNNNEFNWRLYLQAEYVEFLLEVKELSEIYNWNLWGGGVNNYALTISQPGSDGKSISIQLKPNDKYYYYASFEREHNPNNVNKDSYNKYIGTNMDEALKYIHTFLKENANIKDLENTQIVVLGGASDRFPLAYIWAKEELEKTKI